MLVGAEKIRPSGHRGVRRGVRAARAPARRAVPDLRPRRSHARRHREADGRAVPHGRRRAAPVGVVRSRDPRRGDPPRPEDERAPRPDARRRWTGYLDDPDGDRGRVRRRLAAHRRRRADRRRRGGDRRAAQGDDQPQRAADRRGGLRARGAGDRGRAPGPGRGVRRRRRATGSGSCVLAESRYKSARAGEVVLALRARLADAGLPADVVELVPAGFIPRTTSGKLRRGAARELWQSAATSRGEALLPREVPALRVGDER